LAANGPPTRGRDTPVNPGDDDFRQNDADETSSTPGARLDRSKTRVSLQLLRRTNLNVRRPHAWMQWHRNNMRACSPTGTTILPPADDIYQRMRVNQGHKTTRDQGSSPNRLSRHRSNAIRNLISGGFETTTAQAAVR